MLRGPQSSYGSQQGYGFYVGTMVQAELLFVVVEKRKRVKCVRYDEHGYSS